MVPEVILEKLEPMDHDVARFEIESRFSPFL